MLNDIKVVYFINSNYIMNGNQKKNFFPILRLWLWTKILLDRVQYSDGHRQTRKAKKETQVATYGGY